MNSLICSYFLELCRRFLSDALARCSAWVLLSGRRSRFCLNGRGGTQWPLSSLSNDVFINIRNSLSSIENPIFSSCSVFWNRLSLTNNSLLQGSKVEGLPLFNANVLKVLTSGRWAQPRQI